MLEGGLSVDRSTVLEESDRLTPYHPSSHTRNPNALAVYYTG